MCLLPVNANNHKSDVESLDSIQECVKDDDNTETAREERKATGRTVAVVIFLCLMCLAIYHVIQRKTTILAGVSCNETSVIPKSVFMFTS